MLYNLINPGFHGFCLRKTDLTLDSSSTQMSCMRSCKSTVNVHEYVQMCIHTHTHAHVPSGLWNLCSPRTGKKCPLAQSFEFCFGRSLGIIQQLRGWGAGMKSGDFPECNIVLIPAGLQDPAIFGTGVCKAGFMLSVCEDFTAASRTARCWFNSSSQLGPLTSPLLLCSASFHVCFGGRNRGSLSARTPRGGNRPGLPAIYKK